MTPDNIYAKQYGSMVFLKAQQELSRLRNTILIKDGVNAEEVYIDQLDSFESNVKGARLSQTNPEAISVFRRRIALQDYFIAKALDKSDDIRTLADPASAVVKNCANGMGRQIDDLIIEAATAVAYTGKTGTTTVAFPGSQQVAAGAANLTLNKWLEALEKLNAADVDPNEKKFLLIGSSQLRSLLNTTEIKSADYNTVKALVNGQINEFLGCAVIRTERLNVTDAGVRSVLLYTQSAISLAIGQNVISRIDVRTDLHMARQIYFSMSMGASRLEEEKVVEILCAE